MNRLRQRAEKLWADNRARAGAALAANLGYGLFNGLLGLWNRSLWFAALGAYYGILAAARFAAILYRGGKERGTAGRGAVAARWTGCLLAALSLALAALIQISLSQDIALRRGEIVMIAIAAYTFFKIGLAVAQAAKSRGNRDWLARLLRKIRYAETAASVFTLQRSMVSSFGGMAAAKRHMLDVSTGAACCLFILTLGIGAIKSAGKPADKTEP